jgi:hypothetical protein
MYYTVYVHKWWMKCWLYLPQGDNVFTSTIDDVLSHRSFNDCVQNFAIILKIYRHHVILFVYRNSSWYWIPVIAILVKSFACKNRFNLATFLCLYLSVLRDPSSLWRFVRAVVRFVVIIFIVENSCFIQMLDLVKNFNT